MLLGNFMHGIYRIAKSMLARCHDGNTMYGIQIPHTIFHTPGQLADDLSIILHACPYHTSCTNNAICSFCIRQTLYNFDLVYGVKRQFSLRCTVTSVHQQNFIKFICCCYNIMWLHMLTVGQIK